MLLILITGLRQSLQVLVCSQAGAASGIQLSRKT